jgi:hypothetical protein
MATTQVSTPKQSNKKTIREAQKHGIPLPGRRSKVVAIATPAECGEEDRIAREVSKAVVDVVADVVAKVIFPLYQDLAAIKQRLDRAGL